MRNFNDFLDSLIEDAKHKAEQAGITVRPMPAELLNRLHAILQDPAARLRAFGVMLEIMPELMTPSEPEDTYERRLAENQRLWRLWIEHHHEHEA